LILEDRKWRENIYETLSSRKWAVSDEFGIS